MMQHEKNNIEIIEKKQRERMAHSSVMGTGMNEWLHVMMRGLL